MKGSEATPGMHMDALLGLPLEARREIALQLLWSLPREEMTGVTGRLSSMMQKDIIGLLPPELATQILVRLDLPDLLACTLVSRSWARACNDQALWAQLCATSQPPVRPASPTWADITLHRRLMSVRPSTPVPDEMNPEIMEDPSFDLDDRDMPGAHMPPSTTPAVLGPGGIGSVLGRGRFAGVRQSVWERTGLASLPIFTSSPVKQPASQSHSSHDTGGGGDAMDPLILSHLPLPSLHPQVNYKHLYLAHRTASRRLRGESAGKSHPNPMIVDAISSIEAGGLPGHSESIYSLALIHHPMQFTMTNPSCSDCYHNTLFSDPAEQPGRSSESARQVMVKGRDWLLSGSKDKTLRLWQLDCPKPRVVKVFMGAHEGSVLSLFATKIKSTALPASPAKSGSSPSKFIADRKTERLVAVSGGSDGKICLWDLEGDGSVEKAVKVHGDSVLCVRGDSKRIVSSSKDRTIKVLDIHTLETLLVVGEHDPGRHRGALNALSLTDDYVISAGGDRCIKVWCIHTGALLTTVDAAHPRGIASLDFQPASVSPSHEGQDGRRVIGTIVSGSSDATVRLFTLSTVPAHAMPDGDAAMPLVPPMQDLTFQEMLDTDMSASGQLPAPAPVPPADIGDRVVHIDEGQLCWTECLCPPALVKPDASHCMRCWNRGHTDLIRSVSLRGDVVLTGSYDTTVKVWDSTTGRLLNDLPGARTGRVFAVVGDRVRVVSTGRDCRINIWNFAQGIDTSFIQP